MLKRIIESKDVGERFSKRRVTNQEVFNYVAPAMLKQGRCYAPGFGIRYELPRGKYWTGRRYRTSQIVLLYERRDTADGVKEFKKRVQKFAGDKEFMIAHESRYSPVRMLFPPVTEQSYESWESSYEGYACNYGGIGWALGKMGYDLEFLRAIQDLHDDISVRPVDWAYSLNKLARRFEIRGVRSDWRELVHEQEWDYHSPDTREGLDWLRLAAYNPEVVRKRRMEEDD